MCAFLPFPSRYLFSLTNKSADSFLRFNMMMNRRMRTSVVALVSMWASGGILIIASTTPLFSLTMILMVNVRCCMMTMELGSGLISVRLGSIGGRGMLKKLAKALDPQEVVPQWQHPQWQEHFQRDHLASCAQSFVCSSRASPTDLATPVQCVFKRASGTGLVPQTELFPYSTQ